MPFNDYLAHHGILGQKWGVRRYQNPDGSLTNAGKKRYKNKKLSYKEHIAKMSNDELRARITRLTLEKQYKELNPSKAQKARNFVNKFRRSRGASTTVSDAAKMAKNIEALMKVVEKAYLV